MEQFKELGLSNWLCKRIQLLGITSPSNIQREAIPHILSSKRQNVFACSRTGSGKTLAYVLPIIETLVRDPRPYYSLILAPTRELANQIYEMVQALTTNSFAVKSLLIIGGQSQDEAQGLWFGKPNLVVATPGRLLDHLTNRNFLDICGQVDMIKFDMLVLDEADQLISSGFCQQLKEILHFLDNISTSRTHKRQTLLFSATLTSALERLQEVITEKNDDSKPIIINLLPTLDQVKVELATNPDLDQRYLLCPEAIKSKILVTTDLANRGLDLPQVDLVINFNCPKSAVVYVHRVGRTCRKPDFRYEEPVMLRAKESDDESVCSDSEMLSKKIKKYRQQNPNALKPKSSNLSSNETSSRYLGKAITIITQYDIDLFKAIENFVGIKMESEKVDEKGVTSIIKQVAIAIKEAEIRIEKEEQETKHYTEKKRKKQKGGQITIGDLVS
ncbi:hypothetical protein RDWZM_003872 [Blomia tropicalis]|uniref:RNA helicase n=1 Tax=Blomia tropicalis TaxID=40697 RepID=A0A9Q0MJ35_BLOTA|nr:hypothetical protein RDWZM_003872 [Blomia tropicalis]